MQPIALRKVSCVSNHVLFALFIGFALSVLVLCLPMTAKANSKKSQVSYVTGERAALRSEPGDTGAKLLELPKGEEIVVEKWNDGGHSEVSCGGIRGYIESSQLKAPVQVNTFIPPAMGTVNADGVNLRVKSEKDATIINILKKNAQVEVSAMVGDWYCVSADQQVGYVFKDYIDVALKDGEEFSDSGYKTLKMGMMGKEVVRLQRALQDAGYYDGEVNGNYGARMRDAVSAYQADQGMSSDGIADGAVQKALFA